MLMDGIAGILISLCLHLIRFSVENVSWWDFGFWSFEQSRTVIAIYLACSHLISLMLLHSVGK